MSTKCIVIDNTYGKPITLENFLTSELTIVEGTMPPVAWENLELICKDYKSSGKDLIFAHNGYRPSGSFYIGQWNDGVV